MREWLGIALSATDSHGTPETCRDAADGLEQLGFVWHRGHRN